MTNPNYITPENYDDYWRDAEDYRRAIGNQTPYQVTPRWLGSVAVLWHVWQPENGDLAVHDTHHIHWPPLGRIIRFINGQLSVVNPTSDGGADITHLIYTPKREHLDVKLSRHEPGMTYDIFHPHLPNIRIEATPAHYDLLYTELRRGASGVFEVPPDANL